MRRAAAWVAAAGIGGLGAAAGDLRLGMIGLDTSHCIAFTQVLNNPSNKDHVAGARVTVAFPSSMPDNSSSASRVEGFTRDLKEKYGVRIVSSLAELCAEADAVLIEAVDARPHLEQARAVIAAGKPLFVDKPMAVSVRDAREIFRLARERKVPVFSASALRFVPSTQAVRTGSIGRVTYAEGWSTAATEPHHPELFWYGVHGVETLFTAMGPGCETVRRGTAADGRIEVTGTWKDGRRGVYREVAKGYGGLARGEKGEAQIGAFTGYAPLVAAIVKHFQTGVPPVSEEETLEILAFMEASDESKRIGGAPVKIADILAKSAGSAEKGAAP